MRRTNIQTERHTHRAQAEFGVWAMRVSVNIIYTSLRKKEWNTRPATISWCCQVGNKVAIKEYMKMKWISVRHPGLRERAAQPMKASIPLSLPCSLPHDSVEIQYTRTQTLTSTTSDNLLLRSPSFPPHLSFFLAPCFMDAALLHCSLRDSLILWWSQSPSSLILSEPGNHVYNSGNHLNLGKGEKHTGVNEMRRLSEWFVRKQLGVFLK